MSNITSFSMRALLWVDKSELFSVKKEPDPDLFCDLKFLQETLVKISAFTVVYFFSPCVGLLYHTSNAIINWKVEHIFSEHLECLGLEVQQIFICAVTNFLIPAFVGLALGPVGFWASFTFFALVSPTSTLDLYKEKRLENCKKNESKAREQTPLNEFTKNQLEKKYQEVLGIYSFLTSRDLDVLSLIEKPKTNNISEAANVEKFRRISRGQSVLKLGFTKEATLLEFIKVYKKHGAICSLNLDGIPITNLTPFLDLCPNIKIISAKNCSLKNSHVKELVVHSVAKQIEKLDFSDNMLNDVSAIRIARNMEQLTNLSLCGNDVGELGINYISSKMRCLTELNLSGNTISNESVIKISSMVNLELLSIGKSPSYLSSNKEYRFNFNYVREYSLDYLKLGIELSGVQAISRMPKLHTLHLGGANLREGAMEHIIKMKSLKTFDLALIFDGITNEDFIRISQMVWLENLSLSIPTFFERDFEEVFSKLPKLNRLRLSSCAEMPECLIHTIANARSLENFNFEIF